MAEVNAVETLLVLRDQATSGLRAFAQMLRDLQAQVEDTTASIRGMLASVDGIVGAQEEVVGLTAREATLRESITAEVRTQGELLTTSRSRSLELAREELATQREMVGLSRGGSRGGSSGTVGALHTVSGNSGLAGAGLLGIGIASIEMGARYQQLTLEAELALGGTLRTSAERVRDMQQLQRAAKAASESTGFFDESQIMEGLKIASAAGGRGLVSQMGFEKFVQIAPAIAQYMDVVGRIKNVPAATAAAEAIQYAHIQQAYSPEQISKSLNTAALMSLLSSDSSANTLTIAGYTIPQGLNLAGMDPGSLFGLIATAQQQGLGHGRAGGRLRSFLQTLSTPQSPKREASRRELGLGNVVDEHGAVQLDVAISDLLKSATSMSLTKYRDAVTNLFGASGAPIAAMFAHPTAQKLYESNRGAIDNAVKSGDLGQIQKLMKSTPLGLQQNAWSEFKNNLIDFGVHGLPVMNAFFKEALKDLKAVDAWISGHQSDSASIIRWVLGIGGALLTLSALGSIAGSIIKISEAFALLRNAGAVVGGLRVLGGAWSTLGSIAATGQVNVLPAALRSIGIGIEGLGAVLAAPAVLAVGATLAAVGGFVAAFALTTKGANVEETMPYEGLGSAYWVKYLKEHHGQRGSVPTDVLDQLRRDKLLTPLPAAKRMPGNVNTGHAMLRQVNHVSFNITTSKPIDAQSGKEHGEAFRRALVGQNGIVGSGSVAVSPLFPSAFASGFQS